MQIPDDQDVIRQIKIELQRLQDAIVAATREGNIRQNTQLNLEASRLRNRLKVIEAGLKTEKEAPAVR